MLQVANHNESAPEYGRDRRWSGGDRGGSEQRGAEGSDFGIGSPVPAPNTRIVERDGGGADRGKPVILCNKSVHVEVQRSSCESGVASFAMVKEQIDNHLFQTNKHDLRTYRVIVYPVVALSAWLNAFSSDRSMYTPRWSDFQVDRRIVCSVELSASAKGTHGIVQVGMVLL